MLSTAIGVTVGLTLANFGWQAFNEKRWDKAVERSFFQLSAVTAFILALGATGH
jgi:hypothetical protein